MTQALTSQSIRWIQPLRLQYKRVLETSLLISLSVIFILLHTLKLEVNEVTVVKPDTNIIITQMDRTEHKVKRPPPSRPVIPIASDNEKLLPDETIVDTEIDYEQIPLPPKAEDPVIVDEESEQFFVSFDSPPVLIGGYDFIRRNLQYPEIARQTNMEGRVLVRAYINRFGNVVKTEVLQLTGYAGFEEAAVAVVQKCKFLPAKQRDIAVGVMYTIPISFRLH